MSYLITLVRQMIADPAGGSQQFADQDVQDSLDRTADFQRYENLRVAASIVNTSSTGNQAQIIYADYFSDYEYWEADVELQGYLAGAPWVTITPTSSDLSSGHWMFESTPFVNGTVPGQLPPVFATGKTYDPNLAAADLLEFWAATLGGKYDVTVDGQTLRRSQLPSNKMMFAQMYRKRAKPQRMQMVRGDMNSESISERMRLLE
jgi:hypothetical protein